MIGDIIDEVLEVLNDTENTGNTSSNNRHIETNVYPGVVGRHPACLHAPISQEFDEIGTVMSSHCIMFRLTSD